MSDGLVRTPDGVVHYAPALDDALPIVCGIGASCGVAASAWMLVPEQPVTCPTCWQAVAAS